MKKSSLLLFVFAFLIFMVPETRADSACNWGNYSLADTTYLSPSAGENNQTQINDAIASAPQGGSVFLKAGTYVISSPIYLKSNVILEGDKDAVVQLKDHANWKTVSYTPGHGGTMDPLIGSKSAVSGAEVKCFKIDGNYNFRSSSGGGNSSVGFKNCIGASGTSWSKDFRPCESQYVDRWQGSLYYTLIYLSGAQNLSVHDMTFQDGANDGLKLVSANNVRFYNNFVNAMGHEGLFAMNSGGIEVYGNKIAVRVSDGVRGDDCHDYSIHDNEFFSYNGKDSSAGVQIDNKSGRSLYNIQIFRNVFHDIWNGGVWLSVGTAPVSGGKYPVEIHHNIFAGNGYSTNTAVGPTGGIISSANIAALIYNNTFDGNYGSGIYDKNSKARIINNIFTNTKAGKYSGAGKGAGVQGGSDVSYNVFYDNAGGDYTNGGTGNYNGNPLYHEAGRDYHLQSKAGRWDPQLSQWVTDSVNSPAIDAGIPSGSDPTYGEYENEPMENGARVNAGVYGNTSQASLTGNMRQEIMPPAPVADIFSTVIFTPGGGGSSGTGAGQTYVPGSSIGTTGPGSFTGDGTGNGHYGEAGERYDGPQYYDPGTSVLEIAASDGADPAALFAAAELAPIFPELAGASENATAECGVSEEGGGLIPCGRNTDDPSTDWNECKACNLCSMLLMGQLLIELLMKLAVIAAALAIVLAGFAYVFAAGKQETIGKAKDMVKYAIIGFIVVFIAWIVVNSVLAVMGYIDPLGDEWYAVC